MTSSECLSPQGEQSTLDVSKAAQRLSDIGQRTIDMRGSLEQRRSCGQSCHTAALRLLKQGALMGGKALKSDLRTRRQG